MTLLEDIATTNVMPDGMLSTVSKTDEAFINVIKDKPVATSSDFLSNRGNKRQEGH